MSRLTTAVVSAPGAGRVAQAFGPHLIRITAEETGGAMGVFEFSVPPGEGPPLHVHAREDEFFRVLAGRFAFRCGEVEQVVEAGGCVLLPRGVPHTFRNAGEDEGRMMCIVTPGGFEGFFGAVDRRQPEGPEALAAVAAEFGLTFLPADGAARDAA